MTVALDATYSLGNNLSGVGVYSRRILSGLADAHPETRFSLCYRPHRFLRSCAERLPSNCRRRLLVDWTAPQARLFHGLNQRLPGKRPPKCLTTFHDLFVLTGEYSTTEFRRRFAAQAREAAAGSDLIIAVSQFTAGQVRDLLDVPPSRIRVVPHGVSIPPSDPALAREKIVLHVGAIQHRKNISRLVAAFEQLDPGWRLILAGAAGFGAQEILRRINESPRRREIEILGYVADRRLAELYAQAAIFAFPSLDEGFGMPVLDAMAAGLPVLTSDRSATAEVAADAALLVDPVQTSAIAEGLRRMARDESLRQDLTRRGMDRAAQFTWEQAVRRTWDCYRELLG